LFPDPEDRVSALMAEAAEAAEIMLLATGEVLESLEVSPDGDGYRVAVGVGGDE
jgi:hypothetical protein